MLSEPGKIQIQMVEGEDVFNEAISYLNNLPPLKPLVWDENLTKSALEHVNDIGPKGLLIYQSSDGTEPEDRIGKYGTFMESLGENIDFGPNDAMGVIVSLTLDDGEQQRPHRENIFKQDYQKVGIACGLHKTEFQMCVMDFAYDFIPLSPSKKNTNKAIINNSMYNEPVVNLNLGDTNPQNKSDIGYFGDKINKTNIYNNPPLTSTNNQSPLVKLSLDNDDFKFGQKNKVIDPPIKNNFDMNNKEKRNREGGYSNLSNIPPLQDNEFVDLTEKVKEINNNKRIIKKTVEIVTKVTYIYEDDSIKELQDKQCHTFDY